MLAVVSPTSARSPDIAPGSPDHSSARIAYGCSMRGANGDHRRPIWRQRAGAWSDRHPLQHLSRQIGRPQEWANEGLGDARGDRGAPDRCDIPAIQPPRQSQARAMTRSRCGSGGVPSAALSISAGCRWGVRMSRRHSAVAVLLLPWMGQWILAGIRCCGQASCLSRKRACHDDASVQQGQIDNPGATSAPVHLTSSAKYARQCP